MVTLEHILKLPSLEGAKVVTGRDNLHKIISSVSVLENDDPNIFANEPWGKPSYGSEVVLTSFSNTKDNVEAQCQSIVKLARDNGAALIVFYIGIVLPKLDERLIQVAMRYNFTLIMMPENRLDLRYSDVICEIMELVVKDRMRNQFFATDAVEKISQISEDKRKIKAVLDIVYDYTQAEIFVCDKRSNQIATHSRSKLKEILTNSQMQYLINYSNRDGKCRSSLIRGDKWWYTSQLISHSDDGQYYILFLKQDIRMFDEQYKQSLEVLRAYYMLWSKNEKKVSIKHLISSILNDEPGRMFRIAELLHIDIGLIDEMYIFTFSDFPGNIHYEQIIAYIEECIAAQDKYYFIGLYQDQVFLFAEQTDKHFSETLDYLVQSLNEQYQQVNAYVFRHQKNLFQVKLAYSLFMDVFNYTHIIYPSKQIISYAELRFVMTCLKVFEKGEDEVYLRLSIINPCLEDTQRYRFIETLATYTLDAQCSVKDTAQLTYLHPNTVKYRIKVMYDLIEIDSSKMPENYDLYMALAVYRLTKSLPN